MVRSTWRSLQADAGAMGVACRIVCVQKRDRVTCETPALAIAVGDLIEVSPSLKPNGQLDSKNFYLSRTVKSARAQRFFGPLFRDRDRAERTAKAYIHVIVLSATRMRSSQFSRGRAQLDSRRVMVHTAEGNDR